VLLHPITRGGGELHACHQLLSGTRAILRRRRQGFHIFTEHASGRGSKHPLNDMQGSHRKFHTPLPRSKGGTDKRVRSEKEAEVRTKKNCSMPATSKPTGNEKAARQLRRPFLQGRIVPTEANSVKTLWRNLMSVKRGVSINFWEINMFVFSSLQKRSTWLGIVQFPGKTPSGDV
jgi:hypothetical protein